MFRLRCEISLVPLLDFTLHLSTRSLLGFLELTLTRTAYMDPPPIASTSSSSLIPSSSAPNSSSTSSLPSTSQLPQDYSPYLLEPTSASPLPFPPLEAANSPPCFRLDSHPSSLSGTQDLITLFQLDTLYSTFLRPYLPPPSSSSSTAQPSTEPINADSPLPIKGAVSLKGKEKAIVSPPGPQIVASPAPGGGTGGFKITLGGIKFGSSGNLSSSLNGNAGDSTIGSGGKVKRIKMDKNYSHLISDIPGSFSLSLAIRSLCADEIMLKV